MIRCISIILFTCCFLHVRAQERITIEEYVARFRDIAVSEMKRSGVPAAITLAQGILESENGNSELVKKSNNHFGIKCKSTWAGDSVNHDDDAEGECFRAYANAEDSYRDHSNFLKGNQRYASLFNLNPEDYKAWARGLKKAGYATNPRYPDLLIKYIEQYNLQQYTLVALNKMTAPDMMAADTMRSATPAETVSNPSTPTNTESIPADAGRIISINKIKCVYAARGTSLLALATKHNINLNRLMEFNDLAVVEYCHPRTVGPAQPRHRQRLRVEIELAKLCRCLGIPHPDRLVPAGADHATTVPGEAQLADRAVMTAQDPPLAQLRK
ncbi:MAG TPA: glucosaminidase domain-containing protein [Ferruginibacter sp.]|nr:glucosaminidase domain-containing protein [Ferruginibacter sp.]